VVALGQLAATKYDQGNLDEAEALSRRAMEAGLKGRGEKAEETLQAMNNIAMIDTDRGKYDEADAYYKRILDIQRAQGGPDNPAAISTLNNLAQLYVAQDRLQDAERAQSESLERARRVFGDEHNQTILFMNNLAIIERRLGNKEKAEPLYREAYETSKRTLGETSVSTLLPMMNLARFYAATGRCAEKAAFIDQAVALCTKYGPGDSPMIGSVMRTQAECRMASGDYAGAEAPLVEAESRLSKIFSGDEPKIREMREEIATLYDKLGKPGKAAEWRAKAATKKSAPAG
jgi:tetratricopeptide (TPR) repeat protein